MSFRNSFCILLGIVSSVCSCVNHDIVNEFDCSFSGLTLSLTDVDSATNCSTNDGAIRVVADGGKSPYTFRLNDEEFATGDFDNLHAGIYSILVRDANGCEDTINNVLVMAKDVIFATTVEPDSECFSDNGSIHIEVTEGGNPPYQFKLGSGVFSDVNTFAQLAYGSHVIMIKDNNACQMVLNITVPRGQTSVTWTSDIQPLLETKCSGNKCHNGDDRINDFSKYPDAKRYAKQIKTRTQDRSMPFEGSLTQAEIDLIACWVDDGALNN